MDKKEQALAVVSKYNKAISKKWQDISADWIKQSTLDSREDLIEMFKKTFTSFEVHPNNRQHCFSAMTAWLLTKEDTKFYFRGLKDKTRAERGGFINVTEDKPFEGEPLELTEEENATFKRIAFSTLLVMYNDPSLNIEVLSKGYIAPMYTSLLNDSGIKVCFMSIEAVGIIIGSLGPAHDNLELEMITVEEPEETSNPTIH